MIKSVSSTLLVVFAVFSAGSAFKLQPRIFKGISSTRGQFPYYAYLSIDTENGLHDCGGTILNERFILTAAHCIHNAQFVDAFLGTWKIADASEQHRQMHTVSRIIPHEQFSYKTGENDIALLELPAPIEFNEYVKAVNLSRSCDQTESLFVMLIGNGVTEINQNHAASVLQWAPLQTASKLKCKQYYPNINHETAFCAGSREGRAATLGDSGGPLVRLGDEAIIGVTSATHKTEIGYPRVFSNVFKFYDWISSITSIDLPSC